MTDKQPAEILDLQSDIIYGPLNSRRLGRSLGLNLLPTTSKLCSMNCCYCQYGWTAKLSASGEHVAELPTLNDVKRALEAALQSGKEFDYLTFSGNGEATLHPRFAEIVDLILDLRQACTASFKLAMLSNGTTAGDPALRAAFAKIDLPIIKLDAGNEAMFKKMNHGVPPVDLAGILEGIKTLEKVVIQSMFVRGSVDNSTEAEVESWISRLREVRPLWVQAYSLDRGTADKRLRQVSQAQLMEIAAKAAAATGIKVDVF